LEAADRRAARSAGKIRVGRSIVALLRAQRSGDAAAVERALAQLAQPEVLAQTPRDGEGRRALMLSARGTVALWRSELAVAQAAFEAALETARHARLRAFERDAAASLALVCALRGQLKRAARLAG